MPYCKFSPVISASLLLSLLFSNSKQDIEQKVCFTASEKLATDSRAKSQDMFSPSS